MDQTPVEQRLAAAANAIAEMGDLFAARADEFFSAWHRQRVAHEGPILEEDFLAELVRQSIHLDLDGLVGEPVLYVRSASEKDHATADSLVVEVSKETALLLAGVKDEEPEEDIKELEYDEDVTAWAEAIREWMRQQGLDRVGLVELLDGVGFPVVKAWLAVLPGGFEIRQEKEFYDREGIVIMLA